MAIIDDFEDIAKRMKGELKSKPNYETAEIAEVAVGFTPPLPSVPGRSMPTPPPALSPFRCAVCNDAGYRPYFEYVATGQLVNSWIMCNSCRNPSLKSRPQVIRIDCDNCLDVGWICGVVCMKCKNPMGLPQP